MWQVNASDGEASAPALYLPMHRVDGLAPVVIFAHGLGSTNPQARSHLTDSWCQVAASGAELCNASFLTYTARGHGKSTGWETTAESDPRQFTWQRLAHDMIYMADKFKIDRFIAGGSSMGSATSIYCAIQHPERVIGLILVRPPTAWEERLDRRSTLLGSADNLLRQFPEGIYHNVLRGAALSDLPAADDQVWSNIHCPVLILTVAGNKQHPVSVAQTINRLIPQSTLHIAASEGDAARDWTALMAQFITQIRQ